MGRPCRCCGCEPPVVNCYIENGYFYYRITNAESAHIRVSLPYLDEDITLDEDGSVFGSVPIETNAATFTVTATNRCGVTTCEKGCLAIFCWSVYKIGEEGHICSGSGRLDTVTLEWLVNYDLLVNGQQPIDFSTAVIYLNSQQVTGEIDTRIVPCGVWLDRTAREVTALFGRVTIPRCDLEDVYYMSIDATGECGPPVTEPDELAWISNCQRPWRPTFIEKVNTAIIEVDLSDGFSYTRTSRINSGETYDRTVTNQYTLSGMSTFNGTYMLPIICGETKLPCDQRPGYFASDNNDERYILLQERTVSLGEVIGERIQTTTYVNGYYNTGGPNDYYTVISRTRTTGNGYIIFGDHLYGEMRLGVTVTEQIRISENYDSFGLFSRTEETCTAVLPPTPPCNGNPNRALYARCVSVTYFRPWGTGGSSSDWCGDGNRVYGWYVPMEIGHCTITNGVITGHSGGDGSGFNFLALNSNSTEDNKKVNQLCYYTNSFTCDDADLDYLECQSLTAALFGEVRGYYDCL